MFASTYLQVLSVYGGSVSSTGDQLFRRPRKYTSSFCLRGISFVYGGSVSSTGDQLFSKGCAGKTGRTGAAVGCDAARPAARRRVGEPAASAERERRGRQRRCLRLLTYKFFLSTGDQFRLRGISCFADQENTQVHFVYGGSVSSTGDQFRLRGISCFRKVAQEKRAGPARPSGAMRPGRPPGAGSVSRRRRPNARDGGGSADVCVYLLTSSFCLRGISFVYGGSVVSPTKKIHKFILSTGDQFRLRGISCFRKVAQEKRAGPARPSGAMRPGRPPGAGSVSRRRRPNARDGGGSADVCVYLLTSSFCLRGISFVYGGSVVSPTKKIHKFVLSTGDQFRLRGISFVYGGSVVFERLRRKNGPDRRGRRVRCGPAGRPAPGR